ncbi:helix-turn-helix transcriptional regulator [Bacillus cereus]|nr:helix-turn-helix transcriptional regulator [Bacillus cereus]
MELKDRIRSLRKEQKLKQDELGKEIGVNGASVSKFETGLKSPSRETLQRIADYFNVTVDYLLGRSDNPQLDEMLDRKYKELKLRIDQLPEEQQEMVFKQMQTITESFEQLNKRIKK